MKSAPADFLQLALLALRDYAVVILDPQGDVIDWLCGSEDIFGYTADEAIGMNISTLFVEADLKQGLNVHELEVARQDSYSHDDRWHRRQDGTEIWVTGSVTALRDDAGLQGFIKIMRDRTDQRIDWQNRVNQLEALEAARDRTQRFLHTLGHEMRNPMSPIKNAAFIAGRASQNPKVHQAMATIRDQLALLERIASDLMDVSRLHHKKLELRLHDFDVRELLQAEGCAHLVHATNKGIRLDVLLPEQPLAVVADPDRIRQAVSNLLSNAIKYTLPNGAVWIKATQEAQHIVIRIEDTGIGIAPDVLPKIFELFTQEARASDLDPGGLGVGLAIVNQIAELHDGVAQARSGGIGKGSEFTLRIPRAGPMQQESAKPGIV